VIEADFALLQTGLLGQGTFGMVIRATDPETDPPTDVAIKLLPRGNFIRNFKTYVKREILHQSSLKHPFIVSLREVSAWCLVIFAMASSIQRLSAHLTFLGWQVFLTPTHLAIAMEFAQGGDLFHYVLRHQPVCRLSEPKAQWIFQQLIIGLDYCHRRVGHAPQRSNSKNSQKVVCGLSYNAAGSCMRKNLPPACRVWPIGI
jgi:serine/threonine-protein kinase SRK2